MGKKNKKLKKKKQATSENITLTEQTTDTSVVSNATTQLKPRSLASTNVAADENHEYDHVRKDVTKILILMLGIVVLIVILYFVGAKTTFLTTLGDWFYKVLNIKTQ